jgi:soluble lytic murein transglycosylase-like protein
MISMRNRHLRSTSARWLLAGALAFPTLADADIFMRVDEDGVVNLTNVPSGPGFERILTEPVERIAARNEPSQEPPNGKGRARFGNVIAAAAQQHGVSGALLHAVIEAESNYNPNAVSPKGAVGLMQLMPTTARQYGVADSRDPAANIAAGARYLKDLLAMFNNDLTMAVAAYNAGPQSVIRNGNAIPPYRETQRYVPRVLSLYQRNQTLIR